MTDFGLLLLRVSFGAQMLIFHGIPKVMNFSSIAPHFPDPLGVGNNISLGLAVFAEALCAIVLIAGYKTRWVAIPLIVTMLVAIIGVHLHDPWKQKEMAMLYLTAYTVIAFVGAGKMSVDGVLGKK